MEYGQEKGIKFLIRLVLALIAGSLCGFLGILFLDQIIYIIVAILAGLFFAIISMWLLGESNLRGLVAFIVFVVVGMLYFYALINLEEVGYNLTAQRIAMWIYVCGPCTMWAMLLTDNRKGDLFTVSIIKQTVVWVILLVISFIAFKIGVNNYLEERKEDYNKKNEQVVEESKDGNADTSSSSEQFADDSAEGNSSGQYYLNSQGFLVDKVEEFETQTINGYTIKYPILDDGVDEVVVYEFETYDNHHIILDASNIYQQVTMSAGDYGDVELEIIAPGKDIAYLYDGERICIEDYSRNLITISDEEVYNTY